jgi:hypothetical protein
VQFRFRNQENQEDNDTKKVQNIISQIWQESAGAERMLENALLNQVLGGSVFKANFWPKEDYTYGIQITSPMPDFFFPVWDSEDKWAMHEAYMGYYITPEEAEIKYGIVTSQKSHVSYLEHWTRDKYEVFVDGKVPTVMVDGVSKTLQSANPYGIVPFVYIPHPPRAGMFYGMSHVPGILGMEKELNSRMADRGDKVRNQTQDVYALWDSRTALQPRPAGNKTFIDIGRSGPDGKSTPGAALLETSSVGASGGKEFTDDIWRFIQHESDTPGVVWGEDEGSQRSSATLEVRFWPLKVHLMRERILYTEGIRRLNRIMLRMLIKSGQVGKDALKMRAGLDWAQILPRERIDLVNEMTQRKGVDLVSQRQALLALSRGEDVETHLKEIQDEKAEAAKQAMQQAEHAAKLKMEQKPAGGQGGPPERKPDA